MWDLHSWPVHGKTYLDWKWPMKNMKHVFQITNFNLSFDINTFNTNQDESFYSNYIFDIKPLGIERLHLFCWNPFSLLSLQWGEGQQRNCRYWGRSCTFLIFEDCGTPDPQHFCPGGTCIFAEWNYCPWQCFKDGVNHSFGKRKTTQRVINRSDGSAA